MLSSKSKLFLTCAVLILSPVYFFYSGRATQDLEASAASSIESYLSGESFILEEALAGRNFVTTTREVSAVDVRLEPRHWRSLTDGCNRPRFCVADKFYKATVTYEEGQDVKKVYYLMRWDPGVYVWTIVEELEGEVVSLSVFKGLP